MKSFVIALLTAFGLTALLTAFVPPAKNVVFTISSYGVTWMMLAVVAVFIITYKSVK